VSEYDFLRQAGRALNSGQSRALIFSGNVYDLFAADNSSYVPLLDFLTEKWALPGKIVISYELNGPVHFQCKEDREALREAWVMWRSGLSSNGLAIKNMLTDGGMKKEIEFLQKSFDESLVDSVGRPSVAFEFLRQLCLCSRSLVNSQRVLEQELIIIIEASDMLLPEGEITHLSEADRQRVCICHDWFSDPGFINSGDSVVLLCESRSLLNNRIARLPQLCEIGISLPDKEQRIRFINDYQNKQEAGHKAKLWAGIDELAIFSAGMTLHALLQLLKYASHSGQAIELDALIGKVEEYVCAQLGEGVVEFKKPTHTLDDVKGFTELKKFLRDEFIPRCKGGAESAFSGAGVCGPIGGGKSFIFEAVASELGIIVLVLKNIRSQWFGQTDVIFERLYQLLKSLPKVLIFVDEADTQFGGVGANTHPTERRLTGKIQAMMSDPGLKGRVIWLLMTARINLLSPDLRRPGRVGDLIIPVLDPEGDDWNEFVSWVIDKALGRTAAAAEFEELKPLFGGISAAGFSSLRSEMSAQRKLRGRGLTVEEIKEIVNDRLEADIEPMRRYQQLQALLNCTRRSLLPQDLRADVCGNKERWLREIKELESMGYC